MGLKFNLFTATTVALFSLSQGQWSAVNWMERMHDSASVYGFDLFEQTILDIVWPGANNVGVYNDSVNGLSTSQLATDFDDSGRLTPAEIERWSIRQTFDVTSTLNSGARFLQMQFEDETSYSASYGETAANIASQIDAYLNQATVTEELIILYFSNFLNTTTDRDGDLSKLFTIFTNVLSGSMANKNSGANLLSVNDLQTSTISSILSTGSNSVRIIAIADELGDGSDYVYDVNDLMTLIENTTDITNVDDLRTATVGALREGWDYSTLFFVDWSINIKPSAASLDFNFYDDWYEYIRDTNTELSGVINSFPKLQFGNIISVDYFEGTDTLLQAMFLTYEYITCNDNNTAVYCPTEVDLFNNYGTEVTQSECREDFDSDRNITNADICRRSCGRCPYTEGSPGLECTVGSCTAPIYEAILGSGMTGECWERTEEYENLVTEESFCKQPLPYDACASIEDDDKCSGAIIDPFQCDDRCSSNYQCDLAYCSSQYGICMSFEATNDSTPEPTSEKGERYKRVTSDLAQQFLDDIEGLREIGGGDPNGNLTFNVKGVTEPFEFLDKNPYLTSVIGFILIPFVLSLFLFFCWFWVCCFWMWPCCCETCCKRCCCSMCLGENPKSNPVAKWTPFGILMATVCIIVGFSIDGMIGNALMHDHIFSSSSQSVRKEIHDLVDVIQERLSGVPNATDSLINSIFDIVEYTVDAVSNTDEADKSIATMRAAVKRLDDEWAGNITFFAGANDPFNDSVYNYSFDCTFCQSLSSELQVLNDTINTVFVEGINTLVAALNLTNYLESAEDEIDESLDSFSTVINDLINSTEEIRDEADDALDFVQGFDEYRELGGYAYFSLPFLWLIFPILGIFLIATGLSKWCFKLNWCCAMFLGATVMLILSLFAVMTVLWADLCVRLDDFEKNYESSDIGIAIKKLSGLDNNDTELFYDTIQACFDDESLLDVYDLNEYFDEIDSYKDEFQDALDLDLSNQFSSDEFDSFGTEIALLDESTFTSTTDESITTLNEINPDFCYCPIANTSAYPVEFTRNRIRFFECSNNATLNRSNPTNEKDEYWISIFNIADNSSSGLNADAIACLTNYRVAFGYVFAEDSLEGVINNATNDITREGDIITAAVANMTNFVFRIDRILQNVSCLVEDLFDEVDDIIDEYTSCGFLGAAYGGFKEVGCEKLFSDMYRISRAMAIIAFLSIMVTCCSMCMDYVVDPPDDFDDEYDDASYDKKVASNTENNNWDENRASYNQPGVQMTNPGGTEGGGPGQTSSHFM